MAKISKEEFQRMIQDAIARNLSGDADQRTFARYLATGEIESHVAWQIAEYQRGTHVSSIVAVLLHITSVHLSAALATSGRIFTPAAAQETGNAMRDLILSHVETMKETIMDQAREVHGPGFVMRDSDTRH